MMRIYFVCSAIASGAIRAKTNPSRLRYCILFIFSFVLIQKKQKIKPCFPFPKTLRLNFHIATRAARPAGLDYDGHSLPPALKFILRVFTEKEKGRLDDFGEFCVSFSKSSSASQRFRQRDLEFSFAPFGVASGGIWNLEFLYSVFRTR